MKYIKIYGPDDRYIHTMREEDAMIVNEKDIPDDAEIIDSRMLAFLPPEEETNED